MGLISFLLLELCLAVRRAGVWGGVSQVVPVRYDDEFNERNSAFFLITSESKGGIQTAVTSAMNLGSLRWSVD